MLQKVVPWVEEDAVEQGDGDPGEHGGGRGGPGPRLQQAAKLAVVELLEDAPLPPPLVQPPGR